MHSLIHVQLAPGQPLSLEQKCEPHANKSPTGLATIFDHIW